MSMNQTAARQAVALAAAGRAGEALALLDEAGAAGDGEALFARGLWRIDGRLLRTARLALEDTPSQVVSETYVPLGTTDFAGVIRDLSRQPVDGVIMLLMGQDAVHFNRQFARAGLSDRVTFRSESLETLPFADGTFDAIHCRGVLMHVPRWETALAQLCRVLKPGGKIVLMESNTRAVETCAVRLLRLVRGGRSRMVRTAGGLEFWAEKDGAPMVL